MEHLKNFEALADKHDGSRSIIHGHGASVKYILEQLQLMNSTFTITTQQVPLNVQVDEEPPFLSIEFDSYQNQTFEPRLHVAVVQGSGSVDVRKAYVESVGTCDFTSKYGTNWVAIIDPTHQPNCTPCDRLMEAIQQGARGAIFISTPGNQEGYPHPLPPSLNKCGLEKKYLDVMKTIGIVSLSDIAAFQFLVGFMSNRKAKVNLRVVSAYREYYSENIIATSKHGDEEKIVIFGSHLDSVPAGPGINDDASGSMATLELARAFHQSNLATNTTQQLRFAWWTGEEIGLWGSKFYIQNLKDTNPKELKAHKLNIDIDMIASPNYVRGVWIGNTIQDPITKKRSASIHNEFVSWFRSQQLPIYPFEFNSRSDFAPFLENGIPAGGVITGEDEIKSHESAKLFGGIAGMVLDPCYHQDCDRVESLAGPGEIILQQNLLALGHILELYATTKDIEGLLDT